MAKTMQAVLLSKSDEDYLHKCGAEMFTFGIMIGQRAEPNKYIVAHLAKNCEEDVDDSESSSASEAAQQIDDIDVHALASQWTSACRMLPGSLVVLGVFVTGVATQLVDDSSFKSAKRLLNGVHNLLVQSSHFLLSLDNENNSKYQFLAYSTDANKAVCKFFTHSANGGVFAPMECRFVEKPFEWHAFECSYELDDVFPIFGTTQKINIEQQFLKTIGKVKKLLAFSEIFIQNEAVEDAQPLDAFLKQYYASHEGPHEQRLKATIFLPVRCPPGKDREITVREFNGTIRFSGVISSRVFCNPKNTMGDVKLFLRNDILRSLAVRIQVYCDGLTEPNVLHDAIFISEPPRRVYFNLPTDTTTPSPIQFSDYIFRGEAPTVAVAQAKQILDVDISSESICADLEGLPDDRASLSEFSIDALPTRPLTMPERPLGVSDLRRTMYVIGIAVALLVLLLSIVMHRLIDA